MASEQQPKRTIEVMSSDGDVYTVEEAELRLMPMLARKVNAPTSTPADFFYIPYLKSETLQKTVEYCRKHAAPAAGADADAAGNKEDLEAWDAAFIDIPHAQVLDLLIAGNHLGIQSLCDICCDQIVANTIKKYENSEQKKIDVV